jgi:hypothetical protein
VFEIVLERVAEKDLRRLSEAVHDRVVDAIAASPAIRALPERKSWSAAKATGESVLASTASCMRSQTRFESSASIASAAGAMCTAEW